MPMNMKEQAVYQTADTKIENALKDVNKSCNRIIAYHIKARCYMP